MTKPQRYTALFAGLCVVCAIVVFHRVLGFGFINYDDDQNLYLNPFISGASGPDFAHFWTTAYYDEYVPITYTLWGIIAGFAQLPTAIVLPDGARTTLDASPFHAANLVFHCLNIVLVFGLAKRLTKNNLASSAGALLFGVHPLQVSSVAWITGLREILSMSFSLGAILLYLEWRSEQLSTNSVSAVREKLLYASALVAFICAVLCKPIAVVVPAVVLCLDAYLYRHSAWTTIKPLMPWIGCAVAVSLLTAFVQVPETNIPSPSIFARPFIASDAITFYVAKIFWPANLTIDYGRTPAEAMSHWYVYMTILVPVALAIAAILLRQQWPQLALCLLISLLFVLPSLGFVPFLFQEFSTVADRFFYAAMLGPALLVAFVVSRQRSIAVDAVVTIILISCMVMSYKQTNVWSSDRELWSQAIATNPKSWLSYNNEARLEAATGDTARAIAFLEQSIEANPKYVLARMNLARGLARTGRADEAVEQYQYVLAIDPSNMTAETNLGMALIQSGNLVDGTKCLADVAQRNPNLASAHSNLGRALMMANNRDGAQKEFQKALALDPNDPVAQMSVQSR